VPDLTPLAPPTHEDQDADIFSYVAIVWRRKWSFGVVLALVLAAAFVRTMFLAPEMYESSVSVLPLMQDAGGALGMMQQLGGAAGALAGLGLSGASSDGERLTSILRSRSLAEAVACDNRVLFKLARKKLGKLRAKHGLTFGPADVDRVALELLGSRPAAALGEGPRACVSSIINLSDEAVRDAVVALPGWQGGAGAVDVKPVRDAWYSVSREYLTRFREGVRVAWDQKRNTIEVAVQFEDDATLTALLANAYIQQLERYLHENTSTEARRNRTFIEARYGEAAGDLVAAETALERFEQDHDIVSLSEQTAYAVSSMGQLEGILAAKRIERDVLMRVSVSPGSAALAAVETEIAGLDAQLTQARRGEGSAIGTMALTDLPTLTRELRELMRMQVVQETLFTLLAQQYEVAKIDEARDELSFEVLDIAIPATELASPRHKTDMLAAMAIGCAIAACYVALIDMWAARRRKGDALAATGVQV
jgi:uncharacterized protein involved in exopolysaccharide biosynthesis